MKPLTHISKTASGKNDGQTVVRQMTKNSKKVASDSIMNDVMGMFMFEKKVTG